MSFDPDALIARRRYRRKLRWWQLATFVSLTIAIIIGLGAAGFLYQGEKIARIRITGVIIEDPARDDLLAQVAKDSSIRALIVHLDSPGGTVVGGEDLYRSLLVVGENKPVVVIMGTVAASAAYMSAVAAERIFARESTITGSIGVLFQTVDVTNLLSKLGVVPESLKSGPLKAVPSPIEPLTDKARMATQDLIDDLFAFFVDIIVERRDLDRLQVLSLADGRVYTGRQALKNGLIDAIGDEVKARIWLDENKGISLKLPIITLKPVKDGLGISELISRITRKSLTTNALLLDGLLSVWHPDI
ncbi:MAG: signal peptide peptidase SppA [Alphaproteobacteria bacterium]|nr:signal peptide peptidase SppA [Alphaproteobacteria bacterium]